VGALAEGWSYKNHSFSPFCPISIPGNKEMEKRCNDALLEDQMFHIGKKNGRKYIIVPIPLGLPQ